MVDSTNEAAAVELPHGVVADIANQYQRDTGQLLDPCAFYRAIASHIDALVAGDVSLPAPYALDWPGEGLTKMEGALSLWKAHQYDTGAQPLYTADHLHSYAYGRARAAIAAHAAASSTCHACKMPKDGHGWLRPVEMCQCATLTHHAAALAGEAVGVDPHHNGASEWKWIDGVLHSRIAYSKQKWEPAKRVSATPDRIRLLASLLPPTHPTSAPDVVALRELAAEIESESADWDSDVQEGCCRVAQDWAKRLAALIPKGDE